MRRTLTLFVLVAGCGHPAKSTTPPPPLTDPAPVDPVASPAGEPTPAPKPAPPPKDPDPVDVPLATAAATYKLVTPGKGAKTVLKVGSATGTKQTIALAVDFAGKQIAPAEAGGTQEDVAPTLVLACDLEVGEASADGTKFQLAITGVDARDRPGAKATSDQFKTELGVLAGTKMSGTVSPSGQVSNLSLHVDKPTEKTMAALELIRISMMPMWPVLPTEAIGVGAKWQTTADYTIADRIKTKQTTTFEVAAHKGTAWTIKATTKIKGDDQKIGETNFEKIGGTGSFEGTLTDGVFVPVTTTKLVTDFTASLATPPTTTDPHPKPTAVQFHLDQALAVTPK
jgi:hypothetical protein